MKKRLILNTILLLCTSLLLILGCRHSSADEAGLHFVNIAPDTLGEDSLIDNRYPGVAIFDYDRDGDLDFYVTQADGLSPYGLTLPETQGGPNKLFRNDGNEKFTEVAEEAGITALDHNSTGVAACDINNDGYQDLYVAAYGRIGDKLDYRSVDTVAGLRTAVTDRMYINNRDGTFTDVTSQAFGNAPNIRSAMSVACADVDNDGWLDIFVANRADQDYIRFDIAWHHGHYNLLYMNNKDGSFEEVGEEAGIRTGPIIMQDSKGDAITFYDPVTEQDIEGYDVTKKDTAGNLIGEPTGQSLAAMFFDYDDDRDPDLWVADDGDTLKVFRNDSRPGRPKFVSVEQAIGIDKAGAWMGFAIGDMNNDQALDVFVTNIAYHPLTRDLPANAGGDCAYAHQFDWGTCFHYLLLNEGIQEVEGIGKVGMFKDVAGETQVQPDPYLPSQASSDPDAIKQVWDDKPEGLQSYDFGFGTVFFDYQNDGNQDLYWLGAMADKGEGPRGMMWPGTGRMLQGDGSGKFEDVTVETRLLDAVDVDYEQLEDIDSTNDAEELAKLRIGYEFHENGKGVAKGDLNGDGYVDLIGTNSRGFECNPNGIPINADVCPQSDGKVTISGGPLFVWINGGTANNFITLRLKGRQAVDGTGSNADAIGTRVYITTDSEQKPIKQVQEIIGGSSFLSTNSNDLVFGIGKSKVVDEVEIHWQSGKIQTLNNLEANEIYDITEAP